jgi:predicted PurR-regulated permease PerM
MLKSTLSGVGNLISLVFAIFITLTFAIYMISDVSWPEKGLRATIPSALGGDSDYLSGEFVFIWKSNIRG